MSQVHTQLFTDDASGALVERGFRLRVVSGPDAGAEHVLDEGTTLVGTHSDNNIVLTDSTVSRYHLEVKVRRDGVEVRDLDTTNGTRHGATKLGSVIVTAAARLRLGKHTEVDIEPLDELVPLDDWSGDRFGEVLGATPIMKRLFAVLGRVAPTEATVLLEGETGTGKEALAEAIHKASARRNGPFIVVDCGVIPHELIASELFGHARGAYTGATGDKKGLIESANGGTLFLDEIGELALDLQPQLLRVLDRRQVRRVGENHSVDVDIRVIAATHRDLRAMVKSGGFREDLYYRLAVVRTTVPPLRERTADVAALAAHFAAQHDSGDFAMSPSLLDQLQRHPWPGNVRELRNVVERALSLGTAGLDDITVETGDRTVPADRDHDHDAPVAPAGSGTPVEVLEMPFKEAKATLIESFERDYLTHLLARHRGNISRAAAEAGIDRNYIHRLVKKYGLEVDRGMIRSYALAAIAAAGCSSGSNGSGFVAVGSGSAGPADPHAGHGSASESGRTLQPVAGWEPGCVAAFAAARTAAPATRFAALAKACPVCGVGWKPILDATEVTPTGTAADRLEVDAAVKACGGACTGSARDQFLGAFAMVKDERSIDRPWRKLGKDCQGILWPSANERYASASWYVLTQIGRALVGHPGVAPRITVAGVVELPLPASHINGAGLDLPIAASVRPELPAIHINVFAADVRVAPAPVLVVGSDGLVPPTEDAYPGQPVPLDQLATAITSAAPDHPGPVAILSPYAAPARRVLEVAKAAAGGGRALHLAAFGPGKAAGWTDIAWLLGPAIKTTPIGAGDHVAIGLGGDGRVGIVSGTTVRDACAGTRTGERIDGAALVAHAKPSATTGVVIAVDDSATADDLAAVIEALAAAGVAEITLAPAGAAKWPADLQPCK